MKHILYMYFVLVYFVFLMMGGEHFIYYVNAIYFVCAIHYMNIVIYILVLVLLDIVQSIFFIDFFHSLISDNLLVDLLL